MKVLVMVGSYPPNLDSCARLYSQLSESLVDAGHSVTVISEHPSGTTPIDMAQPYFKGRPADEIVNGVRVLRVSPLTHLTKVPGGKAIRFFLSCVLYACRGLLLKRHNVVLVYSPPLYMGIAGYLLSLRHRASFVLNVQDIHPKVLFDAGAIQSRWLKAILVKIETLNYRYARSLIVYSNGNRQYLQSRNVKGRIHVIPNWVDSTEFGEASINTFRADENIGVRFLISYVGTMQAAQALETVLVAAEQLREYREIVFYLAGDGESKAGLARTIAAKNLENVLLRPAMTAERYVRCLQASDLCLVTLGADVPSETVPGKLAYIMASGRPVLAAVNPRGDAARIIEESGAGACVNSNDGANLSRQVLKLSRDSTLRLEMGRKAKQYADTHFSRQSCTREYEQVLLAAVTPTQSPTS